MSFLDRLKFSRAPVAHREERATLDVSASWLREVLKDPFARAVPIRRDPVDWLVETGRGDAGSMRQQLDTAAAELLAELAGTYPSRPIESEYVANLIALVRQLGLTGSTRPLKTLIERGILRGTVEPYDDLQGRALDALAHLAPGETEWIWSAHRDIPSLAPIAFACVRDFAPNLLAPAFARSARHGFLRVALETIVYENQNSADDVLCRIGSYLQAHDGFAAGMLVNEVLALDQLRERSKRRILRAMERRSQPDSIAVLDDPTRAYPSAMMAGLCRSLEACDVHIEHAFVGVDRAALQARHMVIDGATARAHQGALQSLADSFALVFILEELGEMRPLVVAGPAVVVPGANVDAAADEILRAARLTPDIDLGSHGPAARRTGAFSQGGRIAAGLA